VSIHVKRPNTTFANGAFMAIQEVIRMGHPALRLKAQPVSLEEIKTEEFRDLIQDMFDTMEDEEGVGIAAPQINVSKQVAIVGMPSKSSRYSDVDSDSESNEEEEEDDFEAIVIINPEIKPLEGEMSGFWEGCLSVPGLRGYVERPSKIQVTYYDLEGQKHEEVLDGFAATVFQHECDHLEGKLYIDHIKDPTKLSYIEEYLEFIDTEDQPEV
jgi:peptide deformylase